MTAGEADAQAEKHLAHRVDHVLMGQVHVLIDVVAEAAGNRQETGGDHAVRIGLRRTIRRQDVAGDLVADELVIGHVAVERGDDPVAIPPRMGQRMIGVLAGGVGIAHQVEPVPSPALAVMRRGEQPIDDRANASGASSARKCSTSSG